MNKELEKSIKIFSDLEIDDDDEFEKARKIILNYIENSIPKKVVEEKMVIDIDKLNHSVNGILSEMYKARITLEKKLLEEK